MVSKLQLDIIVNVIYIHIVIYILNETYIFFGVNPITLIQGRINFSTNDHKCDLMKRKNKVVFRHYSNINLNKHVSIG